MSRPSTPTPRALRDDEIPEIVSGFAQAARNAGFDVQACAVEAARLEGERQEAARLAAARLVLQQQEAVEHERATLGA